MKNSGGEGGVGGVKSPMAVDSVPASAARLAGVSWVMLRGTA